MEEASFCLLILTSVWTDIQVGNLTSKNVLDPSQPSETPVYDLSSYLSPYGQQHDPTASCTQVLQTIVLSMQKHHRSLSTVATSNFVLELSISLYTILNKKWKTPKDKKPASISANNMASRIESSPLFNNTFEGRHFFLSKDEQRQLGS